jgi:hypothetical protein
VGTPTLGVASLSAKGGGGTAVTFNGTTQYARNTAAVPASVTTQFCIEMLFRTPSSYAGTDMLFTVGLPGTNGFTLNLTNTGTMYIEYFGPPGGTGVSPALSVSTTYHLAFVRRTNGTSYMYINGTEDVHAAAGVGGTPTAQCALGAKPDGTNPTSGTFDEVVFYATPPSAARILVHAQAWGLA